MVKVCSLSSGSKGNTFFIKTGSDVFLIDAGISCKQICLRLEEIGCSYREIKGIFITHEHSDHIRGLSVFLKKHPVQVFISRKTYQNSSSHIPDSCLKFINNNSRIEVNGTTVEILKKSHDAVDPSIFNFIYKDFQTSFITDAGYGCSNVINSIKESDIIFLESNYDEDMLLNGIYPPFLQKRVSGTQGHLSNKMAAELIKKHASPKISHIFLSHISENNNTPALALRTFNKIVQEREDLLLKTHLTSAWNVSPVVEIKEFLNHQ